MEKQLDLKFCNLIYSDKDRQINREKKLIIKAFDYNKIFFNIEIAKFKIRLIYSRKEFDKFFGRKSKSFITGFTKGKEIFIFAYSIFDKETIWKKKAFYESLLHEINHLFYDHLSGCCYSHIWLSEGLATLIQNHGKKFKYKKGLKITKTILKQGYNKITPETYQIYILFVEYLINEFGKNKIIKLIKGLKSGDKLNDLFQRIYKKSFDNLIEDGNKYHPVA